MVCTPDTVYVLGGQDPEKRFTSSLWKFSSDAWSFITPTGNFPPRVFHTLNYVYPSLYAFGGEQNEEPTAEMWILDVDDPHGISRNHWVLAQPPVSPSPRMRHRTVTVGKMIYSFFGIGADHFHNSVYEFSTESLLWRRAHIGGTPEGTTSVPAPRFDPCCTHWPERSATICFGGTTEENDVNEVWVFSHATYSWQLLFIANAAIVMPRRAAVCGIVNNSFLVFGGFESTKSEIVGRNIYSLDLLQSSLLWTRTANDGPEPRDSATMCDRFHGTAVLFGGAGLSGALHNDLWKIITRSDQTLGLSLLVGNIDKPPKRRNHASIVIGTRIVIAFGIQSTHFTNDVWAFHVKTDTWEQLSALNAFPGRHGAACVVRGENIIFFGGVVSTTDESQLSSQLLEYDTTVNHWLEIVSEHGPTEGRAYHGMVNSGSDFLVFGGIVASGAITRVTWDVRIFDPIHHKWSVVYPANKTIEPKARYLFGFVLNTHTRTVCVIGGLSSRSAYHDRWELSPVKNNGTHFLMGYRELPSVMGAVDERVWIRGAAAVAGYQSHYLVCGGLISPKLGPPDRYQCYEYNALNGTHTLLPPWPFPTHGGSLSYVGNKVVAFGGGLVKHSVRVVHVEFNFVLELVLKNHCANGSTSDADCMFCAPGSVNPSCAFAKAGSYQANPAAVPIPCPKGSFSSFEGAHSKSFCRFCDHGFYTHDTGSSNCTPCPPNYVCPLGQADPRPLSASSLDICLQPRALHPPVPSQPIPAIRNGRAPRFHTQRRGRDYGACVYDYSCILRH